MPRLLAFLCHPDDAEILVGGTLQILKNLGWEVGIATMTAGDRGSAQHTREEITRIRYEEAVAAARMLGAWYACAGLHDMEVYANAENARRTVEIMRRFDPDVVLAHSPSDYLLDHEESSRLVRQAAFALAMPLFQTGQVPPAPLGRRTPALYYADPVEGVDPMGNRVYPQFYVEITEAIDAKTNLLACHASQREWLRSYHGVDEYLLQMRKWAERAGREAGCGHAEGFRQHKGHGYCVEPVLQQALGARVHVRSGDPGRG